MSRYLHYPLWVHTPSLALVIGYVGYWLTHIDQLPNRLPIRFGLHGQPVAYGSPWCVFGITVTLALIFIGLSVVMEELWARQERRKHFNFLVLLDELVVGIMIGIQIGCLISRPACLFPWRYMLGFAGGAVAVGAWLEHIRPVSTAASASLIEPAVALRQTVAERLARGERIGYWDIQNPRYISVISLAIPTALWIEAGFQLAVNIWPAVPLFALGAFFLLFYGGQRTMVTPGKIRVRYGFLGITVARIDTNAVRDVAVLHFSPLRDFGGYGIRRNRRMTAYYLCGDHGVVITTNTGRKILIGSNTPDRLAAVIAGIVGVPAPAEIDEQTEE